MTSEATDSNTLTSPAYGPSGRGQWVITSVKPSSSARPTISSNAPTLERANCGDESRLRCRSNVAESRPAQLPEPRPAVRPAAPERPTSRPASRPWGRW